MGWKSGFYVKACEKFTLKHWYFTSATTLLAEQGPFAFTAPRALAMFTAFPAITFKTCYFC